MTKLNKKQINLQKAVDAVAKAGAYVFVFCMASYGLRQLLKSLTENIAIGITLVVILFAVYIITRK